MKKLLVFAIIAFLIHIPAHASSLKVIAVDGIKPLKNVRIECNNIRTRTDENGERVFALSPGKYTVIGPEAKTDGWVYRDADTIAVLQNADVNLQVLRDDLGNFPYEGKTVDLEITYETPFNFEIKLKPAGIPNDWTVVFSNETLQPDSKSKVTITVPEGSKAESESIQFLGLHSGTGQTIAASKPIRLMRGWKTKPRESARNTVRDLLPIGINIQQSRMYGKIGTLIASDVDLSLQSNLSPQLSGQAQLRFTHDWKPQDDLDLFEMRLANLTYMTGIFNLSVGRIDLAPIIRPGEFFGSYLTMGQRRFDGIFFFMPVTIFGTAGVDAQGFQLPPAALSIGYFPNFFSFFTDQRDYDNGFILAEFKMPIILFNNAAVVALNYATTTDYSYLLNSPLSGNPALSATVEYTFSNNYRAYGEFAIGNIDAMDQTTALMTGASAKNLKNYTLGFIDEVAVEYQIPLISSDTNPFIGGNAFHPDQAQQQQGSWYVKLRTYFDFLVFTAAATNSVGDWTFARPVANSFEPNRTFSLGDLRSANEVADLGKTLLSSAYDRIAFLMTVGIAF